MAATRFVWYELMTTGPSAAEEFYRQVVGWGTQPFTGHEHMDYTMWTAGEEPIGGLMELPEQARKGGAPPHWMGYVGVADVDAVAETAGRLGGCLLVPPRDIPGAGRFAVIADPQGATCALYQSGDAGAGGQQPPAAPGRVSAARACHDRSRAGARLLPLAVRRDRPPGHEHGRARGMPPSRSRRDGAAGREYQRAWA